MTQNTTSETMYRVWFGDGSQSDGAEVDDFDDAIEIIATRRGYSPDDAVVCEHCAGGAWSVYASDEDADEDEDGAYADTIRQIEDDE